MRRLWATIQTYRPDTEVLRQVQAKSSRLETLRDSGGGETMSDVKPCPHCGESRAFVEDIETAQGLKWYVFCYACGATGGYKETPSKAIEAWNTRASDNASDKDVYDAGFTSGIKATLQQLYGLLHEDPSLDDIEAWADRQWEEEI